MMGVAGRAAIRPRSISSHDLRQNRRGMGTAENVNDEAQHGVGDKKAHAEEQAEQEVFDCLLHKSPQFVAAIPIARRASAFWRRRISLILSVFGSSLCWIILNSRDNNRIRCSTECMRAYSWASSCFNGWRVLVARACM